MLLQYGSGLIAALAAKGAVPLSLSAIQKLRLIQDKCSEWRTLGRFLGLLAMARWGATLTKKTHWSEWLRWASSELSNACLCLRGLSRGTPHVDSIHPGLLLRSSHTLLSLRAPCLSQQHRVCAPSCRRTFAPSSF